MRNCLMNNEYIALIIQEDPRGRREDVPYRRREDVGSNAIKYDNTCIFLPEVINILYTISSWVYF